MVLPAQGAERLRAKNEWLKNEAAQSQKFWDAVKTKKQQEKARRMEAIRMRLSSGEDISDGDARFLKENGISPSELLKKSLPPEERHPFLDQLDSIRIHGDMATATVDPPAQDGALSGKA